MDRRRALLTVLTAALALLAPVGPGALACRATVPVDGLNLLPLFQDGTGGVLTNEETARKVGEAIMVELYGAFVSDQLPFTVQDGGDSWLLWGRFDPEDRRASRLGRAIIRLSKCDGRVLFITMQPQERPR